MDDTKRLYRSRKDRMIAGVCGGIAEYFKVDPVWIRLAAVLLVFADGAGLIVYILAWVLIPENPSQKKPDNPKKAHHKKKAIKEEAKHASKMERGHDKSSYLFGLFLILFGAILLFRRLFDWFDTSIAVYIGLIVVGVYLILRKAR